MTHDYYVGKTDQGVILPDGETFNVPAGVTVMVDAAAVIRMSKSNITLEVQQTLFREKVLRFRFWVYQVLQSNLLHKQM